MAKSIAGKDEHISSTDVAFGRVLRDARLSRKMSQDELAFKSGYHRNFIGLVEQGKRSPSLRTFFNLAVTLKISPSTLIRRVERLVHR